MVAREYDYWLLDLDGTLIDVDWSYPRSVFDRVGDRLGREFTDREAEILWHGLGGNRNEQLRKWGIDPEDFWPAFHDIEDPQRRAEETYLYDDAAFVADLDCPVGLVTHCQSFLADPVLDELGIRDWFDTVICCDEDLGWKPDPAPLHHAREQIGVHGDGYDGVYAGDGASDVGAAWNAGLDAIHVERHGHHRREQCVLGDYRVESFDELLAMAESN
ncbi:HAD family hydrolase [Halorussus gelatinilyticus]|uniref:HAD family hydrolase n=1 Tax=Halorussus gelatinilyticus TaxID=2937524 RepID=A0A8U0IIG0_9EURY|nr:HAD family hydrolase [Halorussus gelatinilyticus]UPW00890.1 HAD family hydrolase [Halorussus gelatinilyticus]